VQVLLLLVMVLLLAVLVLLVLLLLWQRVLLRIALLRLLGWECEGMSSAHCRCCELWLRHPVQ